MREEGLAGRDEMAEDYGHREGRGARVWAAHFLIGTEPGADAVGQRAGPSPPIILQR